MKTSTTTFSTLVTDARSKLNDALTDIEEALELYDLVEIDTGIGTIRYEVPTGLLTSQLMEDLEEAIKKHGLQKIIQRINF